MFIECFVLHSTLLGAKWGQVRAEVREVGGQYKGGGLVLRREAWLKVPG